MMKKKSNLKAEQLKSFLQSPDKKQRQIDQQYQQYLQDNTVCYICSKILGQKRKKCGFCNFFICTEHLRKKRKNKGVFDRICDSCEDKYLFESYMKYQMKAQQSIAIQMQIVKMKNQSYKDQLQAKKIKYSSLKSNELRIAENYIAKMQQLNEEQQEINKKQRQLLVQQQSINKSQKELEQVEKITPRSLQDDYKMMQKQSDKLNKDLNKLQKRCQQIKISIQKKQKELQNQFRNWQARVSKQDKKMSEQKCLIF